jgi:cell division protein FtsQ
MSNKKSRNSSKANISFRRRLWTYYQRFALILKLLIILAIVAFFYTNILDNYKRRAENWFFRFSANYGFVLENIVIEGQKNTTLKEIVDSLMADKGVPIFSIDIEDVKERLEENVWVKAAVIERRLPSTIYIAVVERTPIAIWQFEQKLYLIDSEGNRISSYTNQELGNLLQVVGSDANIYAESLLDELNKYPNLASKVKSAVRYGQRRWNLNFKEGITVKMPEAGFALAYEYLNSLDKNNKFFNQGYKMLDLRDANKYYIEKNAINE